MLIPISVGSAHVERITVSLALLLIGVGLCLGTSCGAGQEPQHGEATALATLGPDIRYIVSDATSGRRDSTWHEVQSLAPYPILLPSVLPKGYNADTVQLTQPPAGTSLSAISVLVAFTNSSNHSSLGLVETGHPLTEAIEGDLVDVNGVDGRLQSSNAQLVLTWPVCQRQFMLSGGPINIVTKDMLLKVAASIQGPCQKPGQ